MFGPNNYWLFFGKKNSKNASDWFDKRLTIKLEAVASSGVTALKQMFPKVSQATLKHTHIIYICMHICIYM